MSLKPGSITKFSINNVSARVHEMSEVKVTCQVQLWTSHLGTESLYSPDDLDNTSELASPDLQLDLIAQPLCQATKACKSKLGHLQIIQISHHHTSPLSVVSVTKGKMRPGSSASTNTIVPHVEFEDAGFIFN